VFNSCVSCCSFVALHICQNTFIRLLPTKFFLRLVQYSGYYVEYVVRFLSRLHIFVDLYMRVFPKIAFLPILPFSVLYPESLIMRRYRLSTLFRQRVCVDCLFLFQCLYVDCTAVRVDSAPDWEFNGADDFAAGIQPGAWGRRLARWLPPWMYVHPSCRCYKIGSLPEIDCIRSECLSGGIHVDEDMQCKCTG
jgi:hypothetical protein